MEFRMLVGEELADAIFDDVPQDLFIGVAVDAENSNVVLKRASFEHVVVPFSWFEPRGGCSPDFLDPEITDSGLTIRLGAYEAAGDAVLYDFDPAARERMTKNESAAAFLASL